MTESVAQPNLLSLNHYAAIMGIDPMHFAQGFSTVRPEVPCEDVWFEYDWQNPKLVSRQQVRTLINEAEYDLANELGYWPAPVYVEEEFHVYPHPQRKDLYGFGLNVSLRPKSLRTSWGYVLNRSHINKAP